MMVCLRNRRWLACSAWERKFGLDPHDASDGNGKTIDKYGQYTNLEMYMNSLVHDIIEKQNSGGKK